MNRQDASQQSAAGIEALIKASMEELETKDSRKMRAFAGMVGIFIGFIQIFLHVYTLQYCWNTLMVPILASILTLNAMPISFGHAFGCSATWSFMTCMLAKYPIDCKAQEVCKKMGASKIWSGSVASLILIVTYAMSLFAMFLGSFFV